MLDQKRPDPPSLTVALGSHHQGHAQLPCFRHWDITEPLLSAPSPENWVSGPLPSAAEMTQCVFSTENHSCHMENVQQMLAIIGEAWVHNKCGVEHGSVSREPLKVSHLEVSHLLLWGYATCHHTGRTLHVLILGTPFFEWSLSTVS